MNKKITIAILIGVILLLVGFVLFSQKDISFYELNPFSQKGIVSAVGEEIGVTRNLPSSANPNEIIIVTLNVGLNTSTTSYAIEEDIPNGWIIIDDGGGGTSNKSVLKWASLNAENTTYTYTVQASSQTGNYNFSGIYVFEGGVLTDTLGDKEIKVFDGVETFKTSFMSKSQLVIQGYNITYSYNGFRNFTIQTIIHHQNGNNYTIQEAKIIFPTLTFNITKIKIGNTFKFYPTIGGIPENHKGKWNLTLNVVNIKNIASNGVAINGTSYIFFDRIKLDMSDLFSNYDVEILNKKQILISGINCTTCVFDPIITSTQSNPDYVYKNENDTFNNKEQTNISYYTKYGEDKYKIGFEKFISFNNSFGFIFNQTNVESELALAKKSFDKKIYYEIESDKDYVQHSKYILSRELGKTKKVVNEIGQIEERPLKRFIDFSEIWTKWHNLYWYNTTEENVTICLEWDKENLECLNETTELQNITRTQKRDISMKMYKKTNWIIEFFNLFDLDPSFGDDTDSNWNLGTMNNMEVEGTGAGANLTSNMSSGGYLSRIFDAGSSVDWKNITYILEYPYNEELPANQVDEEWFNMTGNVLLMHFNNDSAYGENDTYIYDFSGMGNNGTVTGAVVNTTDCKFGNCFTFDGDDDYINAGDDNSLNFNDSFTISTWVKTTSEQTPSYHMIAGRSSSDFAITSGDKGYVLLLEDSEGKKILYFNVGGDGGGDDDALASCCDCGVVDGTWHHIVGVKDGTIIYLYVDGIQKGTDSADVGDMLNSNNFYIGKAYTSWAYFNGSIDEVAIWNRSLSAGEIKNLYNRGAIKFSVSTRSCNDASCSGESWNETNNNASFGRYNFLTDSNNQYYQYMFNYSNSSDATVRVNNITIEYEVSNVAPTTPILNAPANNTYFLDHPTLEIPLNWSNSSDTDGDAITYYLEIWNETAMTNSMYVNTSITETATPTGDIVTFPNVSSDDFFWRVLAMDGTANSSWSDLWNVSVGYTSAGNCWTETDGKLVIPPGCKYYTNVMDFLKPA